jgi:archaemetzincin
MAGNAENMKIGIIKVGEVDEKVILFLRDNLPLYFENIEVTETEEGIPLLRKCFDRKRNQYVGDCIIEKIKDKAADHDKILGVIDKDLYSPGLNFIFGIASSKEALIGISRLRNEYYGLGEDKAIFYRRILKEANHELGHTFGLEHCPNYRCVMYFSNSLIDTDKKGPDFCEKCRKKLRDFLKK